jgi:glycosyltransferase involved in cell wall biosynthesis
MSEQSSLRILLVTEASGAGVGRHLNDLAQGLLDRGHAVDLWYGTRRLMPLFAQQLKDLAARGARTWGFATPTGPSLGDVGTVIAFRWQLRYMGPYDMLHGHSSKGGALVRLAFGRSHGARVYTPHALYTLNPQLSWRAQWFYSTVERVLAQRTELIICTSEDERRHALSIGLPESRLVVVHNGLPPIAYYPRSQARRMLGLSQDVPVIGFVGRLCSQKNPVLAMRAHAEVLQRIPNVVLCVIGDGELRAEMAHVSPGSVVFTHTEEADALMKAFDVLLLTSDYESFGYVLLEAAQAGVPAVSTPVGIAPELLKDGTAGITAPANATALADACVHLLTDSVLRSRCGQIAQWRVASFNVDRMVDETLAEYRRALD